MADIIYPAAFHAEQATGGVPAGLSPDVGGGEDSELLALRAAAADSLRRLQAARRETEAAARLGQDLRDDLAGMDRIGRDLGAQMDRLIAEARRMTDYLRR